jgi:hypothetical protein
MHIPRFESFEDFQKWAHENFPPQSIGGEKMEKWLRHRMAIHRSDYEHAVDCLRSAAMRFKDLADIIENDPKYDPVSFLKSSAKQYEKEANELMPRRAPNPPGGERC